MVVRTSAGRLDQLLSVGGESSIGSGSFADLGESVRVCQSRIAASGQGVQRRERPAGMSHSRRGDAASGRAAMVDLEQEKGTGDTGGRTWSEAGRFG